MWRNNCAYSMTKFFVVYNRLVHYSGKAPKRPSSPRIFGTLEQENYVGAGP
jgi:hypothetical protein